MEDIRKLLDDFDESAQTFGYYESEGTDKESDETEEAYLKEKKKLLAGIEALEKLAGVSAPATPILVVARRRKINW